MDMKKSQVLAAIAMLVLAVTAIPIAQSWAAERDAPARSHEWEISKVDGSTSLTLAVGQQIQLNHRVKVSVFVDTDTGWVAGRDVEVDECVTISDTDAGDIGEVCAGATPVTFEYPVSIGPYGSCGRYEHQNITFFVTNDTGKQGIVRWITDVIVPCDGKQTLVPGLGDV